MTLNLTTIATVDIGSEADAMTPEGREQWAKNAAQMAQDRVADWFRGHPAEITATAEVWPTKQGS